MEGEKITFVEDSGGYFVTVVEDTSRETPDNTKKRGKATTKGKKPATHTKATSKKGRPGRNHGR